MIKKRLLLISIFLIEIAYAKTITIELNEHKELTPKEKDGRLSIVH